MVEAMSARAMSIWLGLLAVLVGGYLGSTESRPPVEPEASHPSVTSFDLLTVHVSGRVVEPGVVTVPSGSLVADVIAAAGGALSDARLDLVNLSRSVVGGELIEVPGSEERASNEGAESGLVVVNSANVQELIALPGVGTVLAERIVAHRDAHGPFESVEDLLDVSGIGEAKLANLRDLIRVP